MQYVMRIIGYGFGVEDQHSDMDDAGYGFGHFWEYGNTDGTGESENVWAYCAGKGFTMAQTYNTIGISTANLHYLIRLGNDYRVSV